MKSYIGPGEMIPYTNGGGSTIASGSVVVLTNSPTAGHIGVAEDDIAVGVEGALRFSGVVALPKKANDTFAIGDNMYWDATNLYLTSTSTSNALAGVAAAPALAADATARVHLNRR